jgi:hypothetical protein
MFIDSLSEKTGGRLGLTYCVACDLSMLFEVYRADRVVHSNQYQQILRIRTNEEFQD